MSLPKSKAAINLLDKMTSDKTGKVFVSTKTEIVTARKLAQCGLCSCSGTNPILACITEKGRSYLLNFAFDVLEESIFPTQKPSTKNFNELRNKMSPERRQRNDAEAEKML